MVAIDKGREQVDVERRDGMPVLETSTGAAKGSNNINNTNPQGRTVTFRDRLFAVSSAAMTQEEHRREIRERQLRVPTLTMDYGGVSAHLGKGASPGCMACKRNKWITVFVGKACNAACSFCPQAPKPKLGDPKDRDDEIITSFGRGESSILLQRLGQAIERGSILAVGYSGGEPLLYVDRIVKYAGALAQYNRHLYQYVYTNGLLATLDRLKTLRSIGIREVRFDLAATDFSRKAMNNLAIAREAIPFITVEVPALRDIGRKIKENIEVIISSGVRQINLCEIVINEYNWCYFSADPYYLFNPYEKNGVSLLDSSVDAREYRRMVPIWSRHVTYDVIEMAYKGRWPIVINDCAQGIHYKEALPHSHTP